MYCVVNFPTKKKLKEAVKSGRRLTIYAPGLGTPQSNGSEVICGPHAPEPHKWYATVEMKNGFITEVK